MKLHIFQSANGDCILHESADGTFVLCDGGMSSSMEKHVRPKLAALNRLEAVYVSHIDRDHIGGVLTLLRDALDWHVYDHHAANGDTGFAEPDSPRPPEIANLWHNAFRDQVGDNAGSIHSLLTASAPLLLAANSPEWRELGEHMAGLATTIDEGLYVSKIAGPELLGIPKNQPSGGKLMMIRAGQPAIDIGSCRWTIVGPAYEELDDLRKGWNNWLQTVQGADKVREVRAYIRRRVEEFSTGALTESPFDLAGWNGIPDTKGVTAPNVASLMFLVEENGKRVLYTGDSQQDVILDCLSRTGFLTPGGSLHVNVLKVQHHGSENNMDTRFAKTVSADHYIFCGNGLHGNPEERVIQQIYDSRLGPPSKRGNGPDRRFTFWFSTSSAMLTPGSEAHEIFSRREAFVRELAANSGGKLRLKFNTKASITLRV